MPASITVIPNWNLGASGIGSASDGPPAGWAFVYAYGQQVFANGQPLLVPAAYSSNR